MSQPFRIAVAADEPDTPVYLEMLTRMGHQVVAVETSRQFVELCHGSRPDLVILDIQRPDMAGVAASIEVNKNRGIPCILVSASYHPELLARVADAAHVLGYLIKPVSEADVQAAIHIARYRFARYQDVRREADSLRQALADRKLIERAKGAVIRRVGLDEAEAFRRLKKMASNWNRKLAEVAKDVLAAEEVFGSLERDG
jgi:response regulator NasT